MLESVNVSPEQVMIWQLSRSVTKHWVVQAATPVPVPAPASKKGLGGGAIAGIAIGAGAGLAAILGELTKVVIKKQEIST